MTTKSAAPVVSKEVQHKCLLASRMSAAQRTKRMFGTDIKDDREAKQTYVKIVTDLVREGGFEKSQTMMVPEYATRHSRTANTLQPVGSNSTVMYSNDLQVYDPELGVDDFIIPGDLTELRRWYRYFYRYDEIVGACIDIHTEVPLSRIKLMAPDSKDPKKGAMILEFFKEMWRRTNFLQTLLEGGHEYWLMGEAFFYCEEGRCGEAVDEEDSSYMGANYAKNEAFQSWKGKYWWKDIIILDPDFVDVETYFYSRRKRIRLFPPEEFRSMLRLDQTFEYNKVDDDEKQEFYDSLPEPMKEAFQTKEGFDANTDPSKGSFVYHLARTKSQYEARGTSILQRCLRTLVYRDQLRSTQASINMRTRFPIHLIWAEDISGPDVEDLRSQVDMAFMNPDYVIVTNYELHWETKGMTDRLLDLGNEYAQTEERILVGLRVPKELLMGEGSYAVGHFKVELQNTLYMTLTSQFKYMIEEYLLRPICIKNEWTEEDENGNTKVLVPRVVFTRANLRDSQELFDSLFNLYQKGSIPLDMLLETLGLDTSTIQEKLKEESLTLLDPNFNGFLSSLYSSLAEKFVDNEDILRRIMEALGLDSTKSKPEDVDLKSPKQVLLDIIRGVSKTNPGAVSISVKKTPKDSIKTSKRGVRLLKCRAK